MYNKVLKTCQLLSGLADGSIEKDKVLEIFTKYSSKLNNGGDEDKLTKGADILGEIAAEFYLNTPNCNGTNDQKQEPSDIIMNRKQVIKEQNINPGTFDNWRKNGLKTHTPEGGRLVYVKKSDLEEYLTGEKLSNPR